jgi:HK97 family phage major capsid protein
MDQAIKNLLDEQAKTFEAFKKENDANTATSRENAAKLNTRLDEIAQQLKDAQSTNEKLEARLNRPNGGGNDDQADKHAREFSNIAGRPVDTAAYRAYAGAFGNYLRKGDSAGRTVLDAMASGSEPEGGYLITPDMTGRIIKKVEELSPMRQYASVQVISTDALEGLTDRGTAGSGWIGETAARGDTTTPEIGKYRIPVFEMYAQPKATQKMLDDGVWNVESWLGDKVGASFAALESTATITGTVGMRGIASYTTAATADASRTWGTIQHVASGASGAWAATNAADCLLDMIYALASPYRTGAVWAMAPSTVASVRKLKDGQGNYLWAPGSASQPATLHGYGIAEFPDMAAIAANSLSIAFANFREAYQIVDRVGIRTLRDPYTAKPYVVFYSTKRVGGAVVNFDAIKFLKFA